MEDVNFAQLLAFSIARSRVGDFLPQLVKPGVDLSLALTFAGVRLLAAVPVGSFHEFEGIGKMKNDFCQVVDSTSLRALVIDISNQRQ